MNDRLDFRYFSIGWLNQGLSFGGWFTLNKLESKREVGLGVRYVIIKAKSMGIKASFQGKSLIGKGELELHLGDFSEKSATNIKLEK